MTEWAPLVNFLEDSGRLDDYMFMYRAHHGQAELFAYKHCFTRRYLFLDNMGNCYRYAGIGYEKYQQITPREAFEHVYS
jgi:hypothetical protein